MLACSAIRASIRHGLCRGIHHAPRGKLRIIRYEQLPSTHTVCQELLPLIRVSGTEKEDVCVVADIQTKGLTSKPTKDWSHHSKASLAASLGVMVRFSAQERVRASSFIQFLVAEKIIQGLEELFGIHELALKWPNDVYYKDMKCGGILTSMFPLEYSVSSVDDLHILPKSELKDELEPDASELKKELHLPPNPGKLTSSKSFVDYALLVGIGLNINSKSKERELKQERIMTEHKTSTQQFSHLPDHVDKMQLLQWVYENVDDTLGLLADDSVHLSKWIDRVKDSYDRRLLWRDEQVQLFELDESGMPRQAVASGRLLGLNFYGGADLELDSGRIYSAKTRMSMRKV